MDRERFQWLVAQAVDSLPEEFRTKLENIDVVVEDWPTQGQMAEAQGVVRHEIAHHFGIGDARLKQLEEGFPEPTDP